MKVEAARIEIENIARFQQSFDASGTASLEAKTYRAEIRIWHKAGLLAQREALFLSE